MLTLRFLLAVAMFLPALAALAKDKAEDRVIKLDKLTLTAPEGWEKKQPASTIIAYEFHAPAAKDDKQNGRLTIMKAGGSVEANIDRWYAQFSQPDGSKTKDRAKVEKETIAGKTVHVADISGTYKDQRGPMAPAVERENYRMLGAIIETDGGNFFVKLYGPAKTIAEHEKTFRAMLESLK
jgi:hypothetical protein